MTVPSQFNVYETITLKIVSAIEAGAGTFQMPWHGSAASIVLPANASTGAIYRGVNVLALWIEAAAKRYSLGHWATYRQWRALGAQVRGGEHGTVIVFFKPSEKRASEPADPATKPVRFVARASRVFNVAQVEGWTPPEPKQTSAVTINEQVEAFIRATGATIHHGGDMAAYLRNGDAIAIPDRHRFVGSTTSSATESYYATVLHELTHWTGAPHRLDRTFGKRFADRAYAFEELVAELGAAFLCAALGIANEPRADHAAYASSWLQLLESDQRAIFTAAKLAQQAVEFLSHTAARRAAQI